MIANASVQWNGDMAFTGDIDGFKILLDAHKDVGGQETGPGPKKLLLLALAGCTGMDVVSLLKKMRVDVEEFGIDVEASQTEGEHPHVYEWFKIVYKFKGVELDKQMDKITKAINLSMDKYCGVSAMLSKVGPVTYEIEIF